MVNILAKAAMSAIILAGSMSAAAALPSFSDIVNTVKSFSQNEAKNTTVLCATVQDAVQAIQKAKNKSKIKLCCSLTPSDIATLADAIRPLTERRRTIEFDIKDCTGLTELPDDSFNQCWALTSISLPATITKIGSTAFSSCVNITSIDLPDHLKSIGDNAFKYCVSLEKITIPASVSSLGALLFSSCRSLTSISVQSGSKTYCAVRNMILSIDGCTLVNAQCAGPVVHVPESVTTIAKDAFTGNEQMCAILFSKNVRKIDFQNLKYSEKLESVVFSSPVPPVWKYNNFSANDEIPSSVHYFVPRKSLDAYIAALPMYLHADKEIIFYEPE